MHRLECGPLPSGAASLVPVQAQASGKRWRPPRQCSSWAEARDTPRHGRSARAHRQGPSPRRPWGGAPVWARPCCGGASRRPRQSQARWRPSFRCERSGPSRRAPWLPGGARFRHAPVLPLGRERGERAGVGAGQLRCAALAEARTVTALKLAAWPAARVGGSSDAEWLCETSRRARAWKGRAKAHAPATCSAAERELHERNRSEAAATKPARTSPESIALRAKLVGK